MPKFQQRERKPLLARYLSITKKAMKTTPLVKFDSTDKDLILTISRDLIDQEEVQRFVNYLRYKVLVSQSQATDKDVEQLCNQINEGLALRNRSKRMQ